MKTILFSLLGTTLDKGVGRKRWERWRPSVAVCQQEDLLIDEYNLIYPQKHLALAEKIEGDINSISPETIVKKHILDFNDPWDFEEVYSGLYDFLKQFRYNPENNNYLFNITTGTHVAQICIFLLTESHFFPGKILQLGVVPNSIEGNYSIIDLDLSKYEKIASRFADEIKDDISFLKSGIETKNREFNELIERIEVVALKSKEPILLMGPTGSGKSNLAKKIFELKKIRSSTKGQFVEVNCATLRGDSAISTLFGHKKGAFTGAMSDRQGLLKAADNGIIFLDEIGELGLDEQAMLLRAIEEKKFMRLGADTDSTSNFQLICGTNRNLEEDVINGKFREDLLSRINLWTFTLPGLKDRVEDIEPNLKYELNKFAEKTGSIIRFNKETKENFLQFAKSTEAIWSANFRDLNGAIVRMGTLSNGGRINNKILNEEILRLKNKWFSSKVESNFAGKFLGSEKFNNLDLFEKIQLEGVLRVCKETSTISEAGRKLYSNSRKLKSATNDADRLSKYLQKYDLSWRKINAT